MRSWLAAAAAETGALRCFRIWSFAEACYADKVLVVHRKPRVTIHYGKQPTHEYYGIRITCTSISEKCAGAAH